MEFQVSRNSNSDKHKTHQKLIEEANLVWLANVDTLVAKAIIEHKIEDVTRVILNQRATIDGFEFYITIRSENQS